MITEKEIREADVEQNPSSPKTRVTFVNTSRFCHPNPVKISPKTLSLVISALQFPLKFHCFLHIYGEENGIVKAKSTGFSRFCCWMTSHSWRDAYSGMSADNIKGLVLALSSSLFIGSSFIVKKKGLKKAGASGIRAGSGGYSYLYEPLWWVGMITMVVGEVANFAAYAFAPAILVTPLGALSIIISAVLAHIILKERLHIFGVLGCALCVVGSTTIVLHAPQERAIESVTEVWDLATEPAFVFYGVLVLVAVFILVLHYIPLYGHTHVMCYIGVCSLVGSLSVMSVKGLGIALKLTFSGTNQLVYPQTWAFTFFVLLCVITQMNYLNKALDTFNTAVVSPIYYVMFTSLTILASVIMFKDWDGQNPTQIVTELCGFVTILSGTFLLHKTKDMVDSPVKLPKHMDEEDGMYNEGIPLRRHDTINMRSP
ncbi:hypothetical protein L2E82_01655 [Cichorium intybus]|uniref:Uncharacterized protein n=1 Tax=Cichorium intybus TaxID=13427 RepID=A0ACB9H0K6_CICIN|nr:hypothetical protein L2E82_01655 [Cichorium intybus]